MKFDRVASKRVRVSQVHRKEDRHTNEHVCLMYSPYHRICKHHGGPRIREDGKYEQMNAENSLDAGNRTFLIVFPTKRSNGLAALIGTYKLDKHLDSQAARSSNRPERLLKDQQN